MPRASNLRRFTKQINVLHIKESKAQDKKQGLLDKMDNLQSEVQAVDVELGQIKTAISDLEEWIQDDGQSEASITDALSDSVCVGDEDAESDNSEEY